MKEILDKISSYNLFNYLLPGTLFAVIGDQIPSYSFLLDDIILGVFLYYFIGLVISRIGSLIIQPLLQKFRFISFAPYREYLAAEKKDPKLDILSRENNMYRTMCSLFCCILVLVGFDVFAGLFPALQTIAPYGIVVALLTLFLFSYRKQTGHIVKRVEANKNK